MTGRRTEFEFNLPVGYVDAAGGVHVNGVMRLATALDEIEPLSDPRVKGNEAYFGLLLLGRVVRRLGALTHVTPDVIAGLYAADFAYLQAFYAAINAVSGAGGTVSFSDSPALPGSIETRCPHCGTELVLDLAPEEGEAVSV